MNELQAGKWNAEYKTMCLYATISRVPTDQLAGEVYPSVQNISFYGKCIEMNQTQNFPENELLDLVKSGLRTQIVIDKASLFNLPTGKVKPIIKWIQEKAADLQF